MSLNKYLSEGLELSNEASIRLNDMQAAFAAAVSATDEQSKVWHLKRAKRAAELLPALIGKAIAKADECGACVVSRTVCDLLVKGNPTPTRASGSHTTPPSAA
jgi:hypothetical protein